MSGKPDRGFKSHPLRHLLFVSWQQAVDPKSLLSMIFFHSSICFASCSIFVRALRSASEPSSRWSGGAAAVLFARFYFYAFAVLAYVNRVTPSSDGIHMPIGARNAGRPQFALGLEVLPVGDAVIPFWLRGFRGTNSLLRRD